MIIINNIKSLPSSNGQFSLQTEVPIWYSAWSNCPLSSTLVAHHGILSGIFSFRCIVQAVWVTFSYVKGKTHLQSSMGHELLHSSHQQLGHLPLNLSSCISLSPASFVWQYGFLSLLFNLLQASIWPDAFPWCVKGTQLIPPYALLFGWCSHLRHLSPPIVKQPPAKNRPLLLRYMAERAMNIINSNFNLHTIKLNV